VSPRLANGAEPPEPDYAAFVRGVAARVSNPNYEPPPPETPEERERSIGLLAGEQSEPRPPADPRWTDDGMTIEQRRAKALKIAKGLEQHETLIQRLADERRKANPGVFAEPTPEEPPPHTEDAPAPESEVAPRRAEARGVRPGGFPPPPRARRGREALTMAAIQVTVSCPAREARGIRGKYALPGFWSGGRFWAEGSTQATMDDALVSSMEAEILRGESVLTVARQGGTTTAPPPRPPDSDPQPMDAQSPFDPWRRRDSWRFPPND
jgi:hypothetical protein